MTASPINVVRAVLDNPTELDTASTFRAGGTAVFRADPNGDEVEI